MRRRLCLVASLLATFAAVWALTYFAALALARTAPLSVAQGRAAIVAHERRIGFAFHVERCWQRSRERVDCEVSWAGTLSTPAGSYPATVPGRDEAVRCRGGVRVIYVERTPAR